MPPAAVAARLDSALLARTTSRASLQRVTASAAATAIVLLLVRLGMRASGRAARFDDIDWRQGSIRVHARDVAKSCCRSARSRRCADRLYRMRTSGVRGACAVLTEYAPLRPIDRSTIKCVCGAPGACRVESQAKARMSAALGGDVMLRHGVSSRCRRVLATARLQ